MQKNIKKLWAVSATAFIALTSMTYADVDSAQMRNLDNRVSALEQRKGASGMVNPPGRPQVRDGADLFLFGDLLVWNAHQNGLPIAVVNKGTVPSSNIANSKVSNLHSHWNCGFRVGIGYNMPHDGWDVNFTWARLYTHGKKKIHSHSDRNIFPSRILTFDDVASPFAKASSSWRLHFNQLDLDLGREFFVSKWLTLRPHFGLRTDWIQQKWSTRAKNSQDPGSTGANVTINYKDNWWGIGLESGLDTQWSLGSGWSIFGNVAGAIIYGFHDITLLSKDNPAQGGSTEPDGTLAKPDNVYRISHPVLDMMMGVRYDHMFSNDRFHLGLQIGWEHHIYFSQNQFPVFVSGSQFGDFVQNQGDLTFQGWTFAARFDF